MEGGASVPSLTRSDGWILAALTSAAPEGNRVSLRSLVAQADYLNHAILTFDEVSYGLPRLAAAGYLRVHLGPEGLLVVEATSMAHAVSGSIRARTLGGVIGGFGAAISAPPYPEPEIEDRSLGHQAGLERGQWRVIVREYQSPLNRVPKAIVTKFMSVARRQNRSR